MDVPIPKRTYKKRDPDAPKIKRDPNIPKRKYTKKAKPDLVEKLPIKSPVKIQEKSPVKIQEQSPKKVTLKKKQKIF